MPGEARARMTAAEACALGEAEKRDAGYDDDARIPTDHVLDAVLRWLCFIRRSVTLHSPIGDVQRGRFGPPHDRSHLNLRGKRCENH